LCSPRRPPPLTEILRRRGRLPERTETRRNGCCNRLYWATFSFLWFHRRRFSRCIPSSMVPRHNMYIDVVTISRRLSGLEVKFLVALHVIIIYCSRCGRRGLVDLKPSRVEIVYARVSRAFILLLHFGTLDNPLLEKGFWSRGGT
jgi:hypothetical protein